MDIKTIVTIPDKKARYGFTWVNQYVTPVPVAPKLVDKTPKFPISLFINYLLPPGVK